MFVKNIANKIERKPNSFDKTNFDQKKKFNSFICLSKYKITQKIRSKEKEKILKLINLKKIEKLPEISQ